MTERREDMDGIKHVLTDMDGVIVQGNTLLPGAAEFIQRLRARDIPFLILTNNSRFTPRDLQVRLSYMGLDVPSRSTSRRASLRHWRVRADDSPARYRLRYYRHGTGLRGAGRDDRI